MKEKEKNEIMMEQDKTNPEFALEIIYNGESITLDEDKARELAQKGMNYDHVYKELTELREGKNQPHIEKDANQIPQEQPEADRLSEFIGFFKSHPEVKGMADIPRGMMELMAEGKTVEEAFLTCENRMLKGKLAETESRHKSPGALHTEGWGDYDDAFVNMLLAKL